MLSRFPFKRNKALVARSYSALASRAVRSPAKVQPRTKGSALSSVAVAAASLKISNFSSDSSAEAALSRKVQSRFILAASMGDLEKVTALLSEGAVVDTGDYDARTAMHLAAAEGQLATVQLLAEKGANLNVVDRFGSTPLDSAVMGKHDDVVTFLRAQGASLNPDREAETVAVMLAAAASDDCETLGRLIKAGMLATCSDYDLRTPLHLAASEGAAEACKLLIDQGADVNAIDRFGNSPLTDSHRGIGAGFKEVADILRSHGGIVHLNKGFKGPALLTSIQDCMPILMQRSALDLVEAWIPTHDDKEFARHDYWHADPKTLDAARPFGDAATGRIRANDVGDELGRCFDTQEYRLVKGLSKADTPGRRKQCEAAGYRSSVLVPVVHDGRCYAVLQFYSLQPVTHSDTFLKELCAFTNRMLVTGVFGSDLQDQGGYLFHHLPQPQQAQEVFSLVCGMGVFSPCVVYSEVEWFYSMGLPDYYFNRFSSTILANHIHAFIASKKSAQTIGSPEDVWLHIENNPNFGPVDPKGVQALMMIPEENRKTLAAERKLEMLLGEVTEKSAALEYFRSSKSHVPWGRKHMGIYVLSTSAYKNKNLGELGPDESNLDKVASESLLETKTPKIKERYQGVLDKFEAVLGAYGEIFEPGADGSTPVMIALPTGKSDYLLQVTQLLQANGLVATRKFFNTFANGATICSIYLDTPSLEGINSFLDQLKLCYILPQSSLTPSFLNGNMSIEDYSYSSSVGRFVYYFINARTEEYEALLQSLASNPINLGRLKRMHTKMKRDSDSPARIQEVILSNPDIMKLLQQDFYQRTSKAGAQSPELSQDIQKAIARIGSVSDRYILHAIQLFNSCVLKTNFFKSEKEALSFRLEPRFVAESGDWPATPYGVYFVLGSDFQGFHVRFRDISRGGIRLIRSRDKHHYTQNLQTQFAETYGLAYTQNNKNKDIPEFGSKGTILLDPDYVGDGFSAFKKYVSALMDVMIPHAEVADNYGKEELLFLGPDEGTANMMQWAAEYAKVRDYRFWRSFTTGKPPSLGGIPHDTFGMTTRSVHRYVLGCLRKMGIEERDASKVQIGGPDGDLGSNEILLSKDKTKAIADGSGVVYDPNGLDRGELHRMANGRMMINNFDTAKLGEGGFRVLVTENNVTLPDGQMVDSGVKFRDEFHLSDWATADLFVPCGGRPESVNLSNVDRMFFNGDHTKPKFKCIVEGANLFLTNDARMVLEDAGVILFKDASTNKGGVTSSSKEVLGALALTDEVFAANLAVSDVDNPPAFYKEYAQEIMDTVEELADLEFECLWRERERTGQYSYLLTETVSEKINSLNDFIQESDTLWMDLPLRRAVMRRAYPQSLQRLVGVDAMMERVPESYTRAIFACYLASQYVYEHGLSSNEFSFFAFMQPFFDEAKNDTAK